MLVATGRLRLTSGAAPQRMCRAGDDLTGLLVKWGDVTSWADMSAAEPAHERAAEGAGRAMAAAVAAAQAAVACEEGVRRGIAGLALEAERQRDLVQAQVPAPPQLPPMLRRRRGARRCCARRAAARRGDVATS